MFTPTEISNVGANSHIVLCLVSDSDYTTAQAASQFDIKSSASDFVLKVELANVYSILMFDVLDNGLRIISEFKVI